MQTTKVFMTGATPPRSCMSTPNGSTTVINSVNAVRSRPFVFVGDGKGKGNSEGPHMSYDRGDADEGPSGLVCTG